MPISHSVDFLSGNLVIKIASEEKYNNKLKSEIDQINMLYQLYPELMVPILQEGSVGGRYFYFLEKKNGLPLSKIIFDDCKPIEERRKILQKTLHCIKKVIEIERTGLKTVENNLYYRLTEEWNSISFIHDLFEKNIFINGIPLKITGNQVIEKALSIAKKEKFFSVEKAHFNFHFGNILYNESFNEINFIDPDYSVRGIDPLFGLSRFTFSFWHELATGIYNAVKIMPISDAVMFIFNRNEYQRIFDGIPELQEISQLSNWIHETDISRFYALTTYCFLRSIRINRIENVWHPPKLPAIARPEEILMLGCLLYLEGINK